MSLARGPERVEWRPGGSALGKRMANDEERDAIRRSLAGETAAFRLVVDEYSGLLYGTARLLLGDVGEADDIVQETLLSAWRALAGFDCERSLRPWLLQILVNHVRQRRRRRALRVVPLPEWPVVVDLSAVGPEVSAEQQWERDRVRAALSALPARMARLVVLRYFAELTVPEIARVLGMREGTVKSRLHRALQRMRETLEGAASGRATHGPMATSARPEEE